MIGSEMCIKIFTKPSCCIHSSYSVSKVLLKHLRVPVNIDESVRNLRLMLPRYLLTHVKTTKQNLKSTGDEKSDAVENVEHVTNKIRSRPQFFKEVQAYFESNEPVPNSVLEQIPRRIMRRTRSKFEPLYTADSDVARKLVDIIGTDVKKEGLPVFEANPGLGLVSRELLAIGIQELWLFEPSSSFSLQMNSLQQEFPKQVKVLPTNLFEIGKLAFQDFQDGTSQVKDMFSEVAKTKWEDDPAMVIIAVMPSLSFIKNFIQSHVFQFDFLSSGRPEFYFVMSPAQYFYLTCRPEDGNLHYRPITVLFRLIFEWQLLDKFPRKCFLPWEVISPLKKWSKMKKVRSIDPELMYLVKIVPRRDFFQNVVPKNEVLPLWYFVTHHMASRRRRIIPELEKWIPGCGPRIVQEGMTIFTEFGDLHPDEILSIFCKFSSWPEYRDCPFLSSVDATYMRLIASNVVKQTDEVEEDDD